MKKYLVGLEEEALVICKTLADAEEMIFSIAEDDMYECYLYIALDPYGYNNVVEEFIDEYRQRKPKRFKFMEAWYLYSSSNGYWIEEVEELE